VEWIDDLVFPQGTSDGHAFQLPEWLKVSSDAASDNLVQSDAAERVVGGAGLEPAASSV